MTHQFKKIALLAAMTAAFGAISHNAMAEAIFTIDETALPAAAATNVASILFSGVPLYRTVTANKIQGTYAEAVTFGASNTFSTTLIYQALNYLSGSTPQSAALNATRGYNLYATLTANGTYTQSINATNQLVTTFTFAPSVATTGTNPALQVFLDQGRNTTFSDATSASQGTAITGGTGDDIRVATGEITSGGGTLECKNNGSNCGSFGTRTSFTVSPGLGESYFAVPNPFYDMTFSSGDFINFVPAANTTQYTRGSLTLNFEAVPEPESLALLGIGLLGLGVAQRRRKQQA